MKCIKCDVTSVKADYKVCSTCIASLLDEASRPKPIINHLLCYISTYFASSSSAKMQVACLRAFTDAEVFAARDFLFFAYPDQLGPIQKRQDSTNRTSVQAVMEDIYQAFKDLDRKYKIQPLCVSNDLKKVPKNSPEEIDVVCLLEKIRLLENRVNSVETSQQFMSDAHDVNNSKVNLLESDLTKIKNDTETAVKLAKEAHVIISSNKSNYGNAVKMNNKSPLGGRRNSSGRYHSGHRGSTSGHLGQVGASNAPRTSSRLGAPPPSRYLVIAKILRGKTTDDVTSYIKDMDSSIEIRSLTAISHEEAPFQKFKLEVSVSDFHKVSNRSFWEAGVYCYPFRGQWHRDPANNSE